jgi:hypothetical protein
MDPALITTVGDRATRARRTPGIMMPGVCMSSIGLLGRASQGSAVSA